MITGVRSRSGGAAIHSILIERTEIQPQRLLGHGQRKPTHGCRPRDFAFMETWDSSAVLTCLGLCYVQDRC